MIDQFWSILDELDPIQVVSSHSNIVSVSLVTGGDLG